MRVRFVALLAALVSILFLLPPTYGQAQSASKNAKSGATAAPPFDPRDFAGTWYGYSPAPGLSYFGANEKKIPEPPLSEWGKQHLLYKAIAHDALAGTPLPGWDRAGHNCPDMHDPCFSEDPNGVPANVAGGEYPAKDCEPLSTPAQYDYDHLGAMEFMLTREGDRMFQFFEYHREWRTFWFNREHPKDLDPTYEGDSTAHWDGDTLVVDTIGYNDRTMVNLSVGHSKSDTFHLVERWRRVDPDHLELEMTYADQKAWGDKTWPGFKKYLKRVPKTDFLEFICSPREYQSYEKTLTAPLLNPRGNGGK